MSIARGMTILLAMLLLPARAYPAASAPLAVGVTAVGNCKFHGGAAALSFGSLDPAARRDMTASATLMFKCTRGASWNVTDDGGLHDLAAGDYRMRHAALDAYLPYRLSYQNATGTSLGANIEQVLTIDGIVRAAAYVNAPAGSYSDTVTVSLEP